MMSLACRRHGSSCSARTSCVAEGTSEAPDALCETCLSWMMTASALKAWTMLAMVLARGWCSNLPKRHASCPVPTSRFATASDHRSHASGQAAQAKTAKVQL